MRNALARLDLGFAAVDLDALERARAGDGPPLRYRWHEALASLRHRTYTGLSFDRIEQAIAAGDEFIEHYAAQAEAFGCQPVHILKPPLHGGDGAGGGLAWRWGDELRPIGFGPRVIVSAESARRPTFPFVHSLGRNGDVEFVYGPARDAALKAIGLDAAQATRAAQ